MPYLHVFRSFNVLLFNECVEVGYTFDILFWGGMNSKKGCFEVNRNKWEHLFLLERDFDILPCKLPSWQQEFPEKKGPFA